MPQKLFSATACAQKSPAHYKFGGEMCIRDRIYDLDKQEYVEQVTTYPTTTVHKTFFTDEEGYLILPQNLKIGHYRIEEVTAPYGYTLNENYFETVSYTHLDVYKRQELGKRNGNVS